MSYNYKILTYPDGTKEHRFYMGDVRDELDEPHKNDNSGRVKWIQKTDESGKTIYVSDDDYQDVRSDESIEHSARTSSNRSKNMIIEYARANNWEWFFTFTFDPEKVDSFDYDLCYNRLHKWFNNMRTLKAPDIKYLGVPEQHKSGRWHFHILVSNIGGIRLENSNIDGIYNVTGWSYGFSTATAVKDTRRVSTYITKYITKDLTLHTQGKHRYFKSRNLDKAEVRTGSIDRDMLNDKMLNLIASGNHYKRVKGGKLGYITYVQEPPTE